MEKQTKRNADIIIPSDSDHKVAVDILIAKIKSILKEGNL